MHHHRLDELITAKLSGTLDESGREELAALLRQHPEWAQQAALLEQYWHSVPEPEAPLAAVFSEMMAKAEPAGKTTVKAVAWWKWAAAAALAGLLCSAGYHLWQHSRAQKALQLVETRNGERRHFRLSDGTMVHLNASSHLTCRLDSRSREIWLDGEAFFEVAKDPARPFVVHAASMNIHALGTAFNVKAYTEDAQYETTLLEGAVEVYLDKTPEQKVRLRPYEKLAISGATAPASPEKKLMIKPVVSKVAMAKAVSLPVIDSTLSETAWVSNRLQFEALRFDELAKLLERWYGVKIEFRNETVKNYVFSGSFASESITQALQALQLTEEFHFDNQSTRIIIY